jgi:hypothetical protein
MVYKGIFYKTDDLGVPQFMETLIYLWCYLPVVTVDTSYIFVHGWAHRQANSQTQTDPNFIWFIFRCFHCYKNFQYLSTSPFPPYKQPLFVTVLQQGGVVTHVVWRHNHPLTANGGIDPSPMLLPREAGREPSFLEEVWLIAVLNILDI